MSDRVSLIMPSHCDRVHLASRALSHLEEQGFPGEIVVSDHSPGAQAGALRALCERRRQQRILLLEHDPAWHFLERLSDAAEACETDYVAVHADDDFMFMEALDACVDLLESRPDYAAARGRMLFFGDDVDTSVNPHPGCSREEASALSRLTSHLANFTPTLYAVHRRTHFVSACKRTLVHTRNVIFWQYLASCITVLQGKLAVLDRPYYYRLRNTRGWRSSLVRERSFEHWPLLFLAGDFSARLAEFVAGLRTELSAVGCGVDRAAQAELEDACIWLLRRALCSSVRDGYGDADRFFLQRASEVGSLENQLVDYCHSRVR
jgi:glycosyltransferase domain-containing protein